MNEPSLYSRREAIGAIAIGWPSLRSPNGPSPKRQIRVATVIFVRHAEMKPMTKTSKDPGLSKAGRRRAQRLPKLLHSAGVTKVFATEWTRAQETASPLAEALALTITHYGARKTKQFAKQLTKLHPGEVAVVIGHANTVPTMVKALGGELTGLDKWGFLRETEHDRVIIQTLCSATKDDHMQAVQTLDLRIEI